MYLLSFIQVNRIVFVYDDSIIRFDNANVPYTETDIIAKKTDIYRT